jgi:hypothetical protein
LTPVFWHRRANPGGHPEHTPHIPYGTTSNFRKS